MPRKQLRLVEGRDVQPTAENVTALLDEIWQLQERAARQSKQAAVDMRDAAVAKYREFCQNDCFTDDDVIAALQSLPLPTD